MKLPRVTRPADLGLALLHAAAPLGTPIDPAFAMDWVDVSLHLAMSQVSAELAGVFDAWEMCCWLAAPNSALEGRVPIDVLDKDPGAVLQAARMDRFIARG